MNTEEVVRIKKVELLSGTYYIAQARKWRSRLFSESGYEWINFKIVIDGYGDSVIRYVSDDVEYNFREDCYKNITTAEYHCEEYLRVNHEDEVVKVWSVE